VASKIPDFSNEGRVATHQKPSTKMLGQKRAVSFLNRQVQVVLFRNKKKSWQFFVTFLGWLSEPFRG